jgi:hypothetical protein
MSRQFNASLASYNKLIRMMDEIPAEKQPAKSIGLLSPSRSKSDTNKKDMSQPINRIIKHFNTIKSKRGELNGS